MPIGAHSIEHSIPVPHGADEAYRRRLFCAVPCHGAMQFGPLGVESSDVALRCRSACGLHI